MFLPWLSVLLGLLMVSKVKYDTLPRVSRRALKKEPWKFVFAVLAIIVVFVTGGNAIFPLLLLFIVLGLVRYVITTGRKMTRPQSKFEDDEAVEPTQAEP